MHRAVIRVLRKTAAFIVLISIPGGLVFSTVKVGEALQEASSIQIAITIDDLPWSGALPDNESADQALQKIAAVLSAHKVPVTGFVISDLAVENDLAL